MARRIWCGQRKFGGDVSSPVTVPVGSQRRWLSCLIWLAVAQGCKTVQLPVRRRSVTGDFLAPHYLRFVVTTSRNCYAISRVLSKVGANIDSLLQRRGYPKHRLPFVVTTEPCLTSTIETCAGLRCKDGLHAGAALSLADAE